MVQFNHNLKQSNIFVKTVELFTKITCKSLFLCIRIRSEYHSLRWLTSNAGNTLDCVCWITFSMKSNHSPGVHRKGLVYIFASGENSCVAAVQPAASQAPPEPGFYSFESLPPLKIQKDQIPHGIWSFWYTGRDSNPQPSEPESDALSIEPPVHCLKAYVLYQSFPLL